MTTWVETSGARLAVDVDGPTPVPLVLCHGGPGAPDDLAGLRANLRTLGVPCARFDQRGVGRSECRDDRWDLVAYAEDTEAVRGAAGEERIVVVGQSWGGVVARAWAQRNPDHVRGILLVNPSAAIAPDWDAMEAEVMKTIRGLVSSGTWLQLGFRSPV